MNAPPWRAHVARRLDLIAVEALDGVVDREHHQKHIGIGKAGTERHALADEVDGRFDNAETDQNAIYDAARPKNDAKGESAENLVDPIGNDQRHSEDAGHAAPGDLREIEGDRVAQDEVEDGDEDRGNQCSPEHGEVETVVAVGIAGIAEQEIAVVGERV